MEPLAIFLLKLGLYNTQVHRFHYFSLFSNSVQVLNYLIVIGHRTFDLLIRVYCTNHWTTNTTADLKTIPFLSIRNQYRSCRGRCHWGQEASVRHLGQRGQRGLEDGLDRNYRKDSGQKRIRNLIMDFYLLLTCKEQPKIKNRPVRAH